MIGIIIIMYSVDKQQNNVRKVCMLLFDFMVYLYGLFRKDMY